MLKVAHKERVVGGRRDEDRREQGTVRILEKPLEIVRILRVYGKM